jgi:hypothetical protein
MVSYGCIEEANTISWRFNDIKFVVMQKLSQLIDDDYDRALDYLAGINDNLSISVKNRERQKEETNKKDGKKKKLESRKSELFGHSEVNEPIYKYANVFFRYRAERFVALLIK